MQKNKREMVTRPMNVTMTKEAFEEFDKGITHSNNGVRDSAGNIRALPDIQNIPEEKAQRTPARKAQTKYACSFREEVVNPVVGKFVEDVVTRILEDPYIREWFSGMIKGLIHYTIKPKVENALDRIIGDSKKQTNRNRGAVGKELPASEYSIELTDENHKKIPVSSEQAEQLIELTRYQAKRLLENIALLSQICIKDEKTDQEYTIEQNTIKQLLSDESRNTMKMLIQHQNILDKHTVKSFGDFLDGYIQCGEEKIAIPQIGNK